MLIFPGHPIPGNIRFVCPGIDVNAVLSTWKTQLQCYGLLQRCHLFEKVCRGQFESVLERRTERQKRYGGQIHFLERFPLILKRINTLIHYCSQLSFTLYITRRNDLLYNR